MIRPTTRMANKPTLQVITLGCSKNTVDTEHLLAQLGGAYDIRPEGSASPVDILLVNTCGFIGDAKEESVQAVLSAAARKKRGEVGRLLVMGCLSQRYAAELPDLIPEVDAWYGARELTPIITALGCKPGLTTLRYGKHGSYAYLKISEGCDRRCSYCAIPLIRGAHRSVPMEQLVEEARSLADEGVKELVLIAQDTTYYGLDLYHRRALGELLSKLSEIDGIHWIRIHYSYPDGFPEDVLDQMASNPKICRYLDIPLQHISDSVLTNMRRNVDSAWTRALIGKMREKVPGIVLRTTLIVGHPGEGVRQFHELLNFVEESRFERMGAFKYSEEEGTYGAEHFRDSVAPRTKKRRYEKLMELQRGISHAYNCSRVGTEVEVLVDDFVDGIFICRSEFESPDVDGEIVVRHDAVKMGVTEPKSLIGKFMKVRITLAGDYDLKAEFLSF